VAGLEHAIRRAHQRPVAKRAIQSDSSFFGVA
jgi:hypothetical protein